MPKQPTKFSWTDAGRAFCHRCQRAYEDGKKDCLTPACEFYSRMPYRGKHSPKPDLSWLRHNPRQQGYVDWDGNPIPELQTVEAPPAAADADIELNFGTEDAAQIVTQEQNNIQEYDELGW